MKTKQFTSNICLLFLGLTCLSFFSLHADSLQDQLTAALKQEMAASKEFDMSVIGEHEAKLIGLHMTIHILNNLGPFQKGLLAQKCGFPFEGEKERKELEKALKSTKAHTSSGNIYFLNDPEKIQRFLRAGTRVFKDLVLYLVSPKSGSYSLGFVQPLSDIEPDDILKEIAAEANIPITASDIHPFYSMRVTLDREKSKEQRKLIFNLFERIEGEAFNKETFSIEELDRIYDVSSLL